MSLLCGALPLAFFVVVGVSAYTLPRLFSTEKRKPAFVGLALATLAGGLFGAAQLVPTAAHVPYSPRQLGVDYTFASSYAWPKLEYLATLVVPDLFGTEDRSRWFGAFNHWEMAGYYAGAWTVMLAPLGLLRARKKPELWALGGIALLGILLAFGDKGPLHKLFFKIVPLYGTLRCPTRALILDLLALPILAAEGVAWLSERNTRKVLAGIGVALFCAGAVAFVILARDHTPHPGNEQVAREAFTHFAWVVAAGALALIAFSVEKTRTIAPFIVALVTLADLFSISRGYLQPKPADFAAGTERFAAVDWLLDQKPKDRFIPAAHGPFRLHNLGMTYAIEGAGGYDSVTVWRVVNFLWTLNHGTPYPHPKLRDDVAAGTIKRFDSPLVDLLNVRWAISTSPPAAHWIERFAPPPGSLPHAKYEPTWDPQLRVYENPHVLPRAFIVHSAKVMASDEEQARALTTLDSKSTAILDQAPSPEPQPTTEQEPAALITVADRHRVVISTTLKAPGILILSEAWYPGWSVTVDNTPATLLRANYAFRGVALPAGTHAVEMRFSSRPTRLGLGLSLIGLIAILVSARRRAAS
jgi:hypothetical protein